MVVTRGTICKRAKQRITLDCVACKQDKFTARCEFHGARWRREVRRSRAIASLHQPRSPARFQSWASWGHVRTSWRNIFEEQRPMPAKLRHVHASKRCLPATTHPAASDWQDNSAFQVFMLMFREVLALKGCLLTLSR